MNVFSLLGVAILWTRLNRPAKEDPRLSKGLQLLQSKISILEDLSDRTDNQVKQMLKLLEKKGAQVQELIFHAKETMGMIDQSIHKSMEVAEIFQDKIPHEEIIERQSSKKYIEAARMAHQGMSPQEIAEKVDLDIAEIEFIAKVNKDRLMFSEEDLPKWAQESQKELPQIKEEQKRLSNDIGFERDFEKAFENPDISMGHLEELGKKFREACDEVESEEKKRLELSNKLKSGMNSALQSVMQPIEDVKSAIKTELNDLSSITTEDDFDWEEFVASTEKEAQRSAEASIDRVMDKLENDDLTETQETAKVQQTEDATLVEANENNNVTSQELTSSKEENLPAPKPMTQEQVANLKQASEDNLFKAKGNRFTVGIQENALQAKRIETEKPAPKKNFSMDIIDRVKQRAKEKIQSGEIKTKIKSADTLDGLKQLDFPEIKINPNDHLG
jgi:hypothetical protein